ncbi:MAG TPA: heme ABC transporter permease [Alphaproteobacteria bacterium]|nr:heme ABC transporter permease [Alphaproteobacteria bacterium]
MFFTTRLANPGKFLRLADRVIPWLAGLALVFFTAGLYLALYHSPPDYQQGETVRIMYVHVPAAWCGLMIYVAMAVAAGVGFVARHTLADVFCVAAAPVGATFVALCLITGSIWGEPTWGTWWVWDARLTSVLILFLLYCGYIVLRHSFDDHEKGAKAAGILLLTGVVDIPIVRFSVDWWRTLHQKAGIDLFGHSTVPPAMLRPLFAMLLAFTFYAAFLVFWRMKTELTARRIEAREMQFDGDIQD